MSTGYGGSTTNDPGGTRTRDSQIISLVLSTAQPQGLAKINFNSYHYTEKKMIAHYIE